MAAASSGSRGGNKPALVVLCFPGVLLGSGFALFLQLDGTHIQSKNYCSMRQLGVLGAFLLFFSRASQSGQVSATRIYSWSEPGLQGDLFIWLCLSFKLRWPCSTVHFFLCFSSKLGGAIVRSQLLEAYLVLSQEGLAQGVQFQNFARNSARVGSNFVVIGRFQRILLRHQQFL